MFEFATATRIVFGAGKSAQLGAELKQLGVRRVLCVVGGNSARNAGLLSRLQQEGFLLELCQVAAEPSVAVVSAGAALARSFGAEAVVAIGGGSVLDGGKAMAALATQPEGALAYLEVVGRGAPLANDPLPFIALPTTAGTGAEVARNAVISVPEQRVKVSLRSLRMLPKLALVDPELLGDAPPEVVRAAGIDALSQLIESFTSVRNNPLTDALARAGLLRSVRSLRAAVLAGLTPERREDLAFASLCSGLCLANSGLGAVHGFAAPLGGMFDAPHGAVCAALLLPVVRENEAALSARAPASELHARYTELGALLTGRADAGFADALAFLAGLAADLQVPGLSAYGVSVADVPAVVEKARRASSMRGNPVVLTDDELSRILRAAL